jgi:hypothetical protein
VPSRRPPLCRPLAPLCRRARGGPVVVRRDPVRAAGGLPAL